MKKILVIASFFLFISQIAFAQFDEIKTLLTLNQHAKAKEALDMLANKPKVVAKPEYSILKATILSHLIKNAAAGDMAKLREEGVTAYKKYLDLDPSKALMIDPIYSAAPINFYVSFFGESVDFFNKKDWTNAAPSLKTTVEWSDFIIKNKIANMTFDTTANLLAGVSYQNANKEEDAAYFYKRMADQKIGGADNDIVYRFLMNYYFLKDDVDGFNKMKKDGLELYPDVKYFTYNDLDFILEMEDEAKKFKRIEDKISREPNNIEVVQTYGFLLFNRLNAENAYKNLPTYDAEEAKMIDYLTKVSVAKPDEGTALFYAGSHYWNKALRIKDEIGLINDTVREFNASYTMTNSKQVNGKTISLGMNEAQVKEILGEPTSKDNTVTSAGKESKWTYPKPNGKSDYYYIVNGILKKWQDSNLKQIDKTGKTPPPPKELTDRRDNLRKLQDANLDKALPYLLKAVPEVEKSSTKGKTEFQTYKRLIDQLIEIYSTKRQFAKVPADKAKFEIEEKKWDALYTKITEK